MNGDGNNQGPNNGQGMNLNMNQGMYNPNMNQGMYNPNMNQGMYNPNMNQGMYNPNMNQQGMYNPNMNQGMYNPQGEPRKSFNIAKKLDGTYLGPTLKMINRHGLVAGATGTGKTVSVKKFAELLSKEGIPSFLIDIKGDLDGFVVPGQPNQKFAAHLAQFNEPYPQFETFPVTFWDIFGEKGLPIRTTVSNMGPILLSRLLEVNDLQSAVIQTLFKIADENGLLLLDFKDFTELVSFAMNNPDQIDPSYGKLPKASLSAIMRQLNYLESQGIAHLFGEQELNVFDFLGQRDGKGVINVLDATRLFMSPKIYSSFLLWILSEIYEKFEEVGDLDKPRFVCFFDEAHVIFDGISDALLSKIEQIIRLIRSKGIGIYFCTQSPTDIPDSVLSQLGNRIQHAMRAYTAKEVRNLKTAAQGFRLNPELNIEKALMELGVGEALVSFLDKDGIPGVTERAFILSPGSLMGKAGVTQRFNNSVLNQKYREPVERESAYEILIERVETLNAERIAEKERIEAEKEAEKKKKNSLTHRVGKYFTTSLVRRTGSALARGAMGTIKGILSPGKKKKKGR